MSLGQRIPAWIKWFLGIIGLSILLPVLGSSGSILLVVVIAVLIAFPGKDINHPRLFKVMPWLWLLNWIGSCVLAWNYWINKFISQPEIDRISGLEIFCTLVFTPILFVAFVRRVKPLKPILVVGAVLAVGSSLINAIDLNMPELWIDTLGTLAAEIMLISYAWRRI